MIFAIQMLNLFLISSSVFPLKIFVQMTVVPFFIVWSPFFFSVLKTRKDDPLVSKMKVKEFLQAIPGIGGAKADKIMHDANIPGNRRLGGLGIRQVEALLEYLS